MPTPAAAAVAALAEVFFCKNPVSVLDVVVHASHQRLGQGRCVGLMHVKNVGDEDALERPKSAKVEFGTAHSREVFGLH